MLLRRCTCRAPINALKRSIWTGRTIISSSPSSLLSALQNDETVNAQGKPGSVTLFALSKNLPHDTIESARSHLRSLSRTSSKQPGGASLLGVLSDPLPTELVAHLAPAQGPSGRNLTGPYSAAIARYDPRDDKHAIVTFKSTIQGRPNVTLGREIKQKSRIDSEGQSEKAFEEFLKTGKMAFGEGAKEDKPHDLPELESIEPADVKQITLFSADRNGPLLAALRKYAGHAQTLGLMAASTPFQSETQAPFTLYYGDETLTAGAVGIALVDKSGKPSDIQGNVEYSGLQAVDVPCEVTKAQGNIVIELDGKNAARIMLDKVRTLPSTGEDHAARAAEKEKEFYAAVFDRKPTGFLNTNDALHVTRIMSGDPSRGALSIETAEDIKPGYWITILHRPEPASYATFDKTLGQINFVSVEPCQRTPDKLNRDIDQLPKEGDVAVVPGFIAASENGMVLGRKDREPYVTDIDHVVGRTVEERLKERM